MLKTETIKIVFKWLSCRMASMIHIYVHGLCAISCEYGALVILAKFNKCTKIKDHAKTSTLIPQHSCVFLQRCSLDNRLNAT